MAISRLVGLFAATAFAFANLLTVRRSVVSLVLQRQVGNIQIGETVPARFLTGAAVALSVALGAALAFGHGDWTETILAQSGSLFLEPDPYFSVDLGFFVYWLPFEAALWMWSVLVVSTVTTVVFTLYVLTDGVRLQNGTLVASAHVRRHATALVGIFLLLLGWHFRLEMYQLLLGHGGTDAAFSTLDQHVGINGGIVLVVGTLVAGVMVLWTGAAGQFRLSGYAVGGVFALWVLVRQIAPILYIEMSDQSAALGNDRQHVATQAAFTRRAFGVDQITLGDSSLAFPTLARAASALELWDPPALRRAIAPARVPDTSSSWIGWRATPTGLVADVVVRGEDRDDERIPWLVARVDASAVDADGGPVDVADPSAAATDPRVGERGISPPLIFPGATGYAVLPDSFHRIAGIPLVSTGARLAHAWSLQNPGFMFGTLADQHPTLVMHRDLRDRVDRLVPFFVQGTAIMPIIVGDSLYWAIDLYSASAWYPLSHRVTIGGKTWSYFHHAAVAIVDGGTGEVSIVPDATLDPIAKSWVARFPSLFSRWNALPGAVQAALPPPIDAAHARASAFGLVGTLTDRDGPRHSPTNDGSDSEVEIREAVFMLPDASAVALSLPLLDTSEQVSGTLIVTGGRDRRSVWIATLPPLVRWPTVLERLHTLDSTTARRERQIAHGRVRAVPVRGGLSYVQPVFGWPPQSAPSLDYVVFADGDSASRTPSLRDVIGSGDGMAMSGTDTEFKTRLSALWDVMVAAQQRLDWAAYGRAFEAFGRLLGRIHPR